MLSVGEELYTNPLRLPGDKNEAPVILSRNVNRLSLLHGHLVQHLHHRQLHACNGFCL